MTLEIIRNDITKMPVDAIVNAANSSLKMGGGVCGAIFSDVGAEELQMECEGIGKCNVGEAVITKGYNLPARHIIHAVGPIWRSGSSNNVDGILANVLQGCLDSGAKKVLLPITSTVDMVAVALELMGKFNLIFTCEVEQVVG